MQIVTTIKEVREIISQWKKQNLTIGFVPTMGYLHEGHQSLIAKSVSQNNKTVVSIFVNPMQFSPNEDLESYPRDLEKDAILCEKTGADLIFHPQPEEIYSPNFCSFVDMNVLTDNLCGKSRPIHFRGVCTVVSKLFNIVKPDRAYFGEKDAQQLAVIKQMVNDLNIDIEIIGCPIIREVDGLAKSSRNTYLSSQERQSALILSKSLNEGKKLIENGERNSQKIIDKITLVILTEPLATIDYVSIVDSLTMENIETIDRNILVAIAVKIGKTRLIDNFSYSFKECE